MPGRPRKGCGLIPSSCRRGRIGDLDEVLPFSKNSTILATNPHWRSRGGIRRGISLQSALVYRILIDLIPPSKFLIKPKKYRTFRSRAEHSSQLRKRLKAGALEGVLEYGGTRWDRHKVIRFIVSDISH